MKQLLNADNVPLVYDHYLDSLTEGFISTEMSTRFTNLYLVRSDIVHQIKPEVYEQYLDENEQLIVGKTENGDPVFDPETIDKLSEKLEIKLSPMASSLISIRMALFRARGNK